MRWTNLDRRKVPPERSHEILQRVPSKTLRRRIVWREKWSIARNHRVIESHELNAKILFRQAGEYCGNLLERQPLPERQVMHERECQHHVAPEAAARRRVEGCAASDSGQRRLVGELARMPIRNRRGEVR